MSFTKCTYHFVFPTKGRKPLISQDFEREIYSAIYHLCLDKGAKVWRIGGMEEHIHLLADVPANISIADFVKYVKARSSHYIKQNFLPDIWEGWAEGYGCFSVSHTAIPEVRDYIKNQKEHHKTTTFREEYANWLMECGIDKNSPYFPK